MTEPWWATTFDDKYLKTYGDFVTLQRTRREVSFITRNLGLRTGARILDLGCGYGRHTIELASRGYNVTGLDYSPTFLRIAREEIQRSKVRATFIRGDMRSFRSRTHFDAVINMFTSFGYFESEKDHVRVLQSVGRVLKPRGGFLIDVNNSIALLIRFLRAHKPLRRSEQLTGTEKHRLSNGLLVSTSHRLDVDSWRWKMMRTWKENGKQRNYETRVRLFSLPELTHLLSDCSMQVENTWGDFDGSPFIWNSPRLIVLARKI